MMHAKRLFGSASSSRMSVLNGSAMRCGYGLAAATAVSDRRRPTWTSKRKFASLVTATAVAIFGTVLLEDRLFENRHVRPILAKLLVATPAAALIRRRLQRLLTQHRVWPLDDNETDDRIMNQNAVAAAYRTVLEDAAGRRDDDVDGGNSSSIAGGGNVESRNVRSKVVLRVGHYNFLDLGWIDGRRRFVDDRCPIDACWLTSNESLAPTADALLISEFDDGVRPRYLPKPTGQIWIAQHLESPRHNRIDTSALRGLVNWTATYRRDSTIPLPYFKFVAATGTRSTTSASADDAKNRSSTDTVNYAEGRTRMVAWFVSNCGDGNGRLAYGHELALYVPVDVFGACGGRFDCPRDAACYRILRQNYKFYLAFENTNCRDYITEKMFFNAFWRVQCFQPVSFMFYNNIPYYLSVSGLFIT